MYNIIESDDVIIKEGIRNMTDIKINEILYNDFFNLIKTAKENVKTAINLSMVYTYYEIGKRVFLEEQKGHERAVYGDALIDNLSNKLKKNLKMAFQKKI